MKPYKEPKTRVVKRTYGSGRERFVAQYGIFSWSLSLQIWDDLPTTESLSLETTCKLRDKWLKRDKENYDDDLLKSLKKLDNKLISTEVVG